MVKPHQSLLGSGQTKPSVAKCRPSSLFQLTRDRLTRDRLTRDRLTHDLSFPAQMAIGNGLRQHDHDVVAFDVVAGASIVPTPRVERPSVARRVTPGDVIVAEDPPCCPARSSHCDRRRSKFLEARTQFARRLSRWGHLYPLCLASPVILDRPAERLARKFWLGDSPSC